MTQDPRERANQRRGRVRVTSLGVVSVVAAIIAIMVVVAIVVKESRSNSSPASASQQSQRIAYLGVYEPGVPNSYSGIDNFASNVGRQPNLVSYYSSWGEPFQKKFAEMAVRHGATTLIEVDPTNIRIAKIVAGKYDPYLMAFAKAVAAFKHPVIISFGHEMNGYWETWGYHHTPAPTFVAAWRHIVDLFRQRGAGNVKWLWQVNSLSSQTGPVRDWWPGSQYVNWVGVSGYYYLPGDSFDNVFNPVMSDVRRFTHDPVLIAETAVGPQAGQARGIRDLFAGIRMDHYLGLVWFDQHSYGGLYKGEDWRLEDSRPALNAFRNALAG